MLLLVLFLFLILIIGSIVFWSLRNGISPMPTSPKVKQCLLAHLPHLENRGVIYELGSGWGTLAFPLAERFPDYPVIGLETSLVPFVVSKWFLMFKKAPQLRLERKDFFSISLKNATMLVCYLYPEAMRKLKTKFEMELQPGTWVISNTFAIPGWDPLEMYEVDDLYHTKIYLYRWNGKDIN